MPIDISVVICTYNRADLLTGALDSLCQQDFTTDRYEILIVDNASTDNTGEIVRLYQAKYPNIHIRRVYEGRQGLGIARNAAIKAAEGQYIAYLDDDARVNIDWLSKASRHLTDSQSPQCLGGPIQPFYTSEKPTWFKDQYETRTWGRKCSPPQSRRIAVRLQYDLAKRSAFIYSGIRRGFRG